VSLSQVHKSTASRFDTTLLYIRACLRRRALSALIDKINQTKPKGIYRFQERDMGVCQPCRCMLNNMQIMQLQFQLSTYQYRTWESFTSLGSSCVSVGRSKSSCNGEERLPASQSLPQTLSRLGLAFLIQGMHHFVRSRSWKCRCSIRMSRSRRISSS
jgi:hypothetical protein